MGQSATSAFGAIRLVAACLTCLALPPSVRAQADDASAPKILPQDTWTFRNTVEKRGTFRQTRWATTVVRASATSMAIESKEVDSTLPPTERLSGADWSRSRSVNGHQTVVNQPLKFPLVVGKDWTIDYTEKDPNRQHSSEHIQTKYTVVGPDDVTVPAGTFHAVKIEADGEWEATVAPAVSNVSGSRIDAAGATTVMQTNKIKPTGASGHLYKAFWYVPAVKKWVKSVEEYYDANGVRNERWSEELESYKVGKAS